MRYSPLSAGALFCAPLCLMQREEKGLTMIY